MWSPKVHTLVAIILFTSISKYSATCNCSHRFPANFSFGAASSAYQTEGAWNLSGKGVSIWDTMAHGEPELFVDGHNGDVASDSYHKYMEDVELLASMGFSHYRFSIAWSRIQPTEHGPLNAAGLAYYNALIDALLARNIQPMVTMYHWDMPQWLQDRDGGLLGARSPDAFERYADILFGAFGGRVRSWITFNEPSVMCNYAYSEGFLAPRGHSPGVAVYQCIHNVLLAHARIFRLYDRRYRPAQGGQIGLALSCFYGFAKDEQNADDQRAAQRFMEFEIGGFLHPILAAGGGYPPQMVEFVGRRSRLEGRAESRLPEMGAYERALIGCTLDFVGVNYYSSRILEPARQVEEGPSFEFDQEVRATVDPDWVRAKSPRIYAVPEGLRAVLNWIREQYDSPRMYITENGWSDDGQLNDTGRIEYLRTHLAATAQAIEDGCRVQGHTTWSLIDNLEWQFGYTERFGLHHVDIDVPERTRTPKASVAVIRDIIRSRCL